MHKHALNIEILNSNLQTFHCQLTDYGIIAGQTIAVGDEQGIIAKHYNGFADIANKQPISENAIYKMFSMTKPITMLAVMQLME